MKQSKAWPEKSEPQLLNLLAVIASSHLCAFNTTTWGPCRARPVEAPQQRQRLSVQFGYGLFLCYSFCLSISSDHKSHTPEDPRPLFPSFALFLISLSISSDHTWWWCCCLINNSRTFHKLGKKAAH